MLVLLDVGQQLLVDPLLQQVHLLAIMLEIFSTLRVLLLDLFEVRQVGFPFALHLLRLRKRLL